MASTYAAERARGKKEARQQFAAIRERWPLAFPAKNQMFAHCRSALPVKSRPPWIGNYPIPLGVLGSWKMAPGYCEAVLRHDCRIALDGAPAEMVDAKARELAAKRLAELAARKAGGAGAAMAAPTARKPKPAAAPAETAEQLRARVRASLLRRSA